MTTRYMIGRDNPAHVRLTEIQPGMLRNGRTIAEWRLGTSPGNRYHGPNFETWTDGYIEYTDGTREHVIVIQGGGSSCCRTPGCDARPTLGGAGYCARCATKFSW